MSLQTMAEKSVAEMYIIVLLETLPIQVEWTKVVQKTIQMSFLIVKLR